MLKKVARALLFAVGVAVLAFGALMLIFLASVDWVYMLIETVAALFIYTGYLMMKESKVVS